MYETKVPLYLSMYMNRLKKNRNLETHVGFCIILKMTPSAFSAFQNFKNMVMDSMTLDKTCLVGHGDQSSGDSGCSSTLHPLASKMLPGCYCSNNQAGCE